MCDGMRVDLMRHGTAAAIMGGHRCVTAAAITGGQFMIVAEESAEQCNVESSERNNEIDMLLGSCPLLSHLRFFCK